MKDVLFVPGLKMNLFSISALDAKCMRVAFVDGQVLMWPRGKTIDNAIVIGEQEGGLYKLKDHPEQDLVPLVQVINFSTEKRANIHGKSWILPRLSVFFPWKQFRRNRDDP